MYQFKVSFGGGGVCNLYKKEHHQSFINRDSYQNAVFIEHLTELRIIYVNSNRLYIAPFRVPSKTLRNAIILEAVRVLRTVARLHRACTHARSRKRLIGWSEGDDPGAAGR